MSQVLLLDQIEFIRENRHILSGIQLDIRQGEHWVILGRNGSGKTTLLELLNGYQFPTRGKVEVLGYTYGKCDVREVRKRIGYISQSLYEKLNPSDRVWEVVATGEFSFLRFYEEIPTDLREKAVAMLESIHLAHLADHALGMLSQGERKKVMLARSLMTDPSILIMDEPCSGLDLYEREKLLENMKVLAGREITVIYVTHHIEEIMPMFTHVMLIENGRAIASGEKHAVLNEQNLMKAFQVPVRIDWQGDRPWTQVL